MSLPEIIIATYHPQGARTPSDAYRKCASNGLHFSTFYMYRHREYIEPIYDSIGIKVAFKDGPDGCRIVFNSHEDMALFVLKYM